MSTNNQGIEHKRWIDCRGTTNTNTCCAPTWQNHKKQQQKQQSQQAATAGTDKKKKKKDFIEIWTLDTRIWRMRTSNYTIQANVLAWNFYNIHPFRNLIKNTWDKSTTVVVETRNPTPNLRERTSRGGNRRKEKNNTRADKFWNLTDRQSGSVA